MATKLHYFGDVQIASSHRIHAELLLESLRRSLPNTYPTSLKHTYDDGTYVSVQRVSPGVETIDITAGVTTPKKDKMVWTLLYAPSPYPDPQDWPGWIECNRETLVATNFLNAFALILWGNALWDCMGTALTGSSSGSYYETEDCGWGEVGMYDMWGSPDWLYASQFAYARKGNHASQNYSVTFYGGSGAVLFSESYTNMQLNDVQIGASGAWGEIPAPLAVFHDWGYSGDRIDGSDNYFYFNPNVGNTHREETGYIDWTSTYMLGFWKQEWTIYNPSSYLDDNNWVTFYDKYIVEDAGSGGGMGPLVFTYISDSYWDAPGYGSYWGGRTGGAYYHLQDYWGKILATGGQIVDKGITSSFYNYYDPSIFQWWAEYEVYDPWSFGTAEAGGQVYYRVVYTTTIKGMINGVGFEEILGTAIKTGSDTGPWSGTNVFPWMGRIYDKKYLLEGDLGEEQPSANNLLIASWLTADAASLPGMGAGWETPGCTDTGIHTTTYFMKHGDLSVTKAYGAVHPGNHDVYTSDPDSSMARTWRAYGDLFAALKVVKTA